MDLENFLTFNLVKQPRLSFSMTATPTPDEKVTNFVFEEYVRRWAVVSFFELMLSKNCLCSGLGKGGLEAPTHPPFSRLPSPYLLSWHRSAIFSLFFKDWRDKQYFRLFILNVLYIQQLKSGNFEFVKLCMGSFMTRMRVERVGLEAPTPPALSPPYLTSPHPKTHPPTLHHPLPHQLAPIRYFSPYFVSTGATQLAT